MENFRTLDFSHNSIMGIDDNTLVGINTSFLNLSHNNMRKIPTLAFRKLTMVTNLVLDANLFKTLESKSIHNIRVKFLSISHSKHLDHLDKGSITHLPLLQSITLSNNPSLAYIHPGAISDVPNLINLIINNNSLSALEDFRPHIPSLRNVDLKGNVFQCHCSLRWVQNLIRKEDGSSGLVVKDGTEITCGKKRNSLIKVKLAKAECKPFILPLFPQSYEAMIGHNLTWLCKMVGSKSGRIAWSLPQGHLLGDGECWQKRHCVKDGRLFLVFLHPEDAGGYTCSAKNTHGNSSRILYLDVKVIDQLPFKVEFILPKIHLYHLIRKSLFLGSEHPDVSHFYSFNLPNPQLEHITVSL